MHSDDEWDNVETPNIKETPKPKKIITKKRPEERAKKIDLRFTKCCATCEYMSYFGDLKYSWCHFPERTISVTAILGTDERIAAAMENLGYSRTLAGLLCDNWETAPCRVFDRIEKNLNMGPLALPGEKKDGIIEDKLSTSGSRKVK